MKYWILAISLLMFGCGGGEKETVGEEVSDVLNDAQQSAEEVADVLDEKKKELDEAIDEAEGKPDN